MIIQTVCFGLVLGYVVAFPDGAPLDVCEDMIPQHGIDSTSSLNENPYQLLAAPLANGAVSVSVTGTPAFRGILLQARTNEEGRATGTWAAPASENYKLMECNSQSSSALTHANSGEKSNPEFSWNPPEVLNSTSFTFYATVVTSYSVYYVMVSSNPITVSPLGEISLATNATSALATTTAAITERIPSTAPRREQVQTGQTTQMIPNNIIQATAMTNKPNDVTTTSKANLNVPSFCVWIILLIGILNTLRH